ncbi:hypothetical protein MSAN_02220300 [Mycena sanguinolenta]|uniref:2,5-diamino-6-ribosylamino-4(3H)-pyrimidinone 5'-phosphate reductase n=1 Tax=Mycena sanguinolenta TaxID=230812 RepID=A0A8H6XA55_9AGAR|nr:hypothetical protein MSAN_02220300 [Mycena sanguinolenta]
MTAAPEYLTSLLASYAREPPKTRPFVTLTFAQSLDGKIAGTAGKQLALSGHESLVMTHWLRTLHDAILVGSGTALNDDPQLNSALAFTLAFLSTSKRALDYGCPQRAKLLRNYALGSGAGRQPWVVSRRDADPEWETRRQALEKAGARVLVLPAELESRSSIAALLSLLRTEGIRSLMVEGGAQIITAFFGASDTCVDTVLITTAPVLIGASGVSYKVPEVRFTSPLFFFSPH